MKWLLFCIAAFRLYAQPDATVLRHLYEQRLEKLGNANAEASRDLGLFLARNQEREAAVPYLRQAYEVSHSPEDLENLILYLPPAEAMPLVERASKDKDDGVAARNLARLASVSADRAKAITYARAALAREPSAAKRAVRLNDLALLVEPPEALPLLEKALALQIQANGIQHPETATTQSNLGNVYLALDRLDEAERVQRRALQTFEATLRPNHLRLAAACSNLADVLREKKKLSEARALYQRALDIDLRVYGPDHAEVKADRENLASVSTPRP